MQQCNNETMHHYFKILKKEDTVAYQALRLKSYQESPYAFSESYEDECLKSEDEFYKELIMIGEPAEHFVLGVFSKEEKLLGFVKFRKDQRSKAQHKAMIHAMYVDSKDRGQGLGRALILNLLERVKVFPKLEQIHLWVLHAEGVSSADKFYVTLGFERQGPIVRKDLKVNDIYIDAEYMVLYL